MYFRHGNKPGNQNKNPDPDLLPYDSNRVVLNPGSGKWLSDSILFLRPCFM